MSVSRNRAIAIAVLILVAGSACPARADKERSPGILRGLIGELAPGSPAQIEAQALREMDGSEALRLYGALQSRFPGNPEGVRAALWVGLYYYGAGEEESALEYFERARKNARTDDLRQRAEFWCDQTRLRTGREPLPAVEGEGQNPYGVLQALTRVDRSVREGRRAEAEGALLSIEGRARKAGMLGPSLARWGDVLGMPGTGRVNREVLGPLVSACSGLPERLRMITPVEKPAPSETEVWSIQFGAFLDEENAVKQMEELKREGWDIRIDSSEEVGQAWYRTRFGELPTRDSAESAAVRLGIPPGIPYQIARAR